jgi:hypothetical protein
MLLLGAGMGVVFVPLTMASLAGVRPEDSGAASSMVNVTQQVGGSLGLAILVTVFGAASTDSARHRPAGHGLLAQAHASALAQAHAHAHQAAVAHQAAIVHGMASAFAVAAIFDVCALIVILAVIGSRREPRDLAG